jgi:manganese/zinc/iron transport system substrate-binding protein
VLVTAHDAFNYFGKRYGFEVVGIQGISTRSLEAGVRDIERLVDLLVERGVGAVFVESTVLRAQRARADRGGRGAGARGGDRRRALLRRDGRRRGRTRGRTSG